MWRSHSRGQRLPERGRRRSLDVGRLEPLAAVPSGVVADFLTNHGSDRARPCRTELNVSLCFAPLLKWVLTWWRSDRLALAIDPTVKGDDTAAIVISVLYRGCAIPVAPYPVRGRLWRILRAKRPGAWMDPIVELLQALAPAAPEEMTVIVLCDRGLNSPKLWRQIQAQSLPRT